MDSGLTQQPLTPTRAKSAGPHRPYRDPMEDADSPSTRKRPRLDSGDRVHRSMSADPSRAAFSDINLANARATPLDGQPTSQSSETINGHRPLAVTPSKVTINVREPVGKTSPTQQLVYMDGAPSSSEGGYERNMGHTGVSTALESSSPKVISVTSSPSRSPEIEVAEVEDMNDEPGETRWKTLESAAVASSIGEAKEVQAALLDQFPHRSGQSLKRTMSSIATALGKHDLGDGDIFEGLATWVELYLQTTEPLALQWRHMIQDAREFWEEFPSLTEAMMQRSSARMGTITMLYSGNSDTLDARSPLHNFLVAYTSLSLRMARIDHQILVEHFDDTVAPSNLISERYLYALSHFMTPGLGFWRHLVDSSSYECKVSIAAMIHRFTQPQEDGFSLMASISKAILDRSQSLPILIHKFFVQITVVNRLMQHSCLLHRGSTEIDRELASISRGLSSQAYEFFLFVNRRFQTFISKQVPALSMDASQNFVVQLTTLLRHSVASDEQLLQRLINENPIPTKGLNREDSVILVELAWKLETLKKCIFEGRMEIRVQGVDTMQLELVNVYNKFINNNPTLRDHSVPQYLSDFMLANKLVDYFVGVESHPQLIQRCANIIGFLLVTNRYTEAESDTIWKAVTQSQDSRFVEAILAMLPGIFGIASYPVLLYLTHKLNELAVSAFDGSMLAYARHLLESLRRLWKYEPSNPKLDMPPFHLCIRLIRQATVEESLEPSRKRQIHHFAVAELGCCLQFGPSDADRRTIYQECIQDIAKHNDSATGSVSAINVLLSQTPEKELLSLTQNWDLASLVIGEFAHRVQTERPTDVSSLMLSEWLEPRMHLIKTIVLHVPDTITADVGTKLWEYAVGAKALNHRTREIAWMSFLQVIRYITNRNSFIDRCVREYLPRLQPSCYTPGCLHFAQDVSHYHFRTAVSRPQDDVKQETTAEDLLWHMSLTASPGSIERKAMGMLVALYLDSPENKRRTRAAIDAIHVGVAERCVRQLTSAASKLKSFSDGTSSGEDEPMVIVTSEDEVQLQRLSFSRCLTILKEFLLGVRTRPNYSPQPQTQAQLLHDTHEAKGDTVQIRYQPFGVGATGEMRSVGVGDLETMQEFTGRLKLLTGFSKLTLISGGQKLDLNRIATMTLHDLKLDQKGLLLVKKDPDSGTASDADLPSGLRPVEMEILSHFPDLYPLLGMEEKLAKEMFEFLLTFRPHRSIITLVCSEDSPLDNIFPPSAPFKVLYSVYTLKFCRTQNVPCPQDFAIHSIRSLAAALITLNLSIGPQGPAVDITIAAHILDCLMIFLKDPSSFASAKTLFANPSALLDCLQIMIKESLAVDKNADADLVASTSFAAILKVSLHVESFWDDFRMSNMCTMLLKRLLLEEPKSPMRQTVGDSIRAVCLDLHLTPTAPAQEIIPYLWNSIASIIPSCLEFASTSKEFFDLASVVIQCIDHSHRNTLDLALYVRNWSDVLLRHRHEEFVGRESVDWLVHGLSILLNWVFRCAKEVGKALPIPEDLLVHTFRAHLFPVIPEIYERSLIRTRVPNLDSNTREELYSIILELSSDVNSYQTLLMLLKDLLFQGEGSHAWSWGFAQISDEFHFDPSWNFDKSKTIRSSTGYPGMRNLSNTCYMNSLFTHLFMNVKFRGFMLETNVADGANSQKLLQETQTLFGYMQDTMLKSVDSQGIVDSLVTYDNTLIDVSVQMDVDEFYNLLFDRWESQILLEADKKTFRGFYGGQIVQQIKSKECPHISERLEPFSAIQCDIHGKATLMDSLNAYVSGETMEGDNKYSCTSCGCYVDAVKRACFKEIPDNLIFHLKRFDYDLMTGMRSKINDAFEFPHQIDMAPYHVDYQKDTNVPCVPDMFELVGVLVHSGTAESGHYYSYIRERPPNATSLYNWVEFNDVDVTDFDPSNIADQCFGGYAEATHYAHRFQKNWNAYMLFYERIEPRQSNKGPLPVVSDIPSKCPVPPEIERQVALSNAQYLRFYCMYDPAHASFARRFLEQLRDLNMGTCSENHLIEKEAIWLSLDYLERVLSRSKDSSDFAKMLGSLTKVIGSCALCCKYALEWVNVHDYALRNLLLRCPNPKVRKDFASMIVLALQYLKRFEPHWYGFYGCSEGSLESSTKELRTSGAFPHIVSRLAELWTILPSHGRGWDDYFGLLVDLANLGFHEIHVLLNRHILRNCLELLVVEHAKAFRILNENPHYMHYCRLVDKGRRFSLSKLVDLLAILLEKIDLTIDWVPKIQERRFTAQDMPLTKQEDELMQMGHDKTRSKNTCVFLEKILNTACNTQAAQRIIRKMTLAEPQFSMLEHVQKTIMNGINIEPAHLAEPFLESAIAFCEATPSENSARDMIRYIAGEVDTIGDHGGQEHLNFFTQARRIVSLREGWDPGFFNRTVLRTVPQWAPALLTFREEHVRNNTVELLKHLVFGHDIRAMDDEEHAELIETAAKDLQVACTKRCNALVQLQKPVDIRTVEQVMSVIRYCLSHYYSADEDQRPIVEADNVLTALEVLTISDVDEGVSDTWNNPSDEMPTDSDDDFLTTSP